METADGMTMLNNAKRLVCEMQQKRFPTCSTTVDAAAVSQQLQQLVRGKQDIKNKFHKTLTMNSFMQNLSKPREQWDAIVTQNDEELQTARSALKDAQRRVEEEKSQITQFNAVTVEAMALYQENLQSLKDRLEYLENTCQELKTMQDSLDGSGADDKSLTKQIETQLATCMAESRQCRRDLLQLEHKKARTEQRLSHLQEQLQTLTVTFDPNQERMDAQCLARVQKSISVMEELSGVTCQAPSPNTILVTFPPTQSPPSASTSGNVSRDDDPILQVTLTFKHNSRGSLYLSDVQSNVESLDLADVWGEGQGEEVGGEGVDSVPSLIHTIKLRWFSHVPLLSEVSRLQRQSAIDWIQQEGVLRVIVGKGGSIVCSLHIPATYPHQGHITLTSIIGADDDPDLQDIKPSSGGRLVDWVRFLEDTFGKA